MAEPTTLAWYVTTENETNATTIGWQLNSTLYTAYNTMVSITTAFIMLSMGTGVSWEVVKPHLKRPIGPIIGMVCQLVLLPCIAFGLAHAFDFQDEVSIGMIIMASSPGGAVSNIFSFWSRGDLGLR
jgi:sodium/bile acid cotransporter 2